MIAKSNNQTRLIRWFGGLLCVAVVLCVAHSAIAQETTPHAPVITPDSPPPVVEPTTPAVEPATPAEPTTPTEPATTTESAPETPVTTPAEPANPLHELEQTVGPEIKEELKEEIVDAAHHPVTTGEQPAEEEHGSNDDGHGDGKDDGHGGHGTPVDPNPLIVNLDLAVWTGVLFLLLVFVLGKFAWGPIASGLDKREQGIADQIAEANQANEDAQASLAEYQAQLAQARDEVRTLLAEARQDAEKTKTELVDKARVEAAAQHHRAVEQIEAAAGAALKTVATQGADMAVRLAGQILQSELRPQDHQRLIDKAVADMSSTDENAS